MKQSVYRHRSLASILVMGLTMVAFGLRLHSLGEHSLWYDELLQLDLAQGPLTQLKPQLERHAGMPLDYVISHFWLRLGRQEGWVRFPALLFGTLAVPLIYHFGKHLFNQRTGVIAATCLTIAPFAIRYSQEARPYALLMTVTMLGYLGLWRAYQTGQYRYWGLTAFGLSTAVLSHYFALFLFIPAGLFVGLQQLRHLTKPRIWQHSVLFALLVMLILSLSLSFSRADMLYWIGRRFVTDLTQPATLTLPAEEKPNRGTGPPLEASFVRDKIIRPLSTLHDLALLGYNAYLIIALLSLLHKRSPQRSGLLLLVAWTGLPPLAIYLFLLTRGTFFASRYILYSLPAYLLLVAWGIETLTALLARLFYWRPVDDPHIHKFGLLTGMLSLLLLSPLAYTQSDALTDYYAAPAYEDWRAVGRLLEDNAWANDAIIAIRAEPTMNWYYPPARAAFGLYSRNDTVWAAINDHTRRWFILSSYSFKRTSKLRQWLTAQGAVVIFIDRRIAVYFHQEGFSPSEHLDYVRTSLTLPQHAITYAKLAAQYQKIGDLAIAQTLYQQAIALSTTNTERTNYQIQLAQISGSP